jgi:hypothetical protein
MCDECGMAYSLIFEQQFHRVGCKAAEWEAKVAAVAAKIERAAEIHEEIGAYEAAVEIRKMARERI